MTNPAVERVMTLVYQAMADSESAAAYSDRGDDVAYKIARPLAEESDRALRAEIAAMVEVLQRAQVRLDHFDSGEDDETGRLINDIHAALRGKTTEGGGA